MLDISHALQQLGVAIDSYRVTQLTLDSRAVVPGSAFIAIKGHQQNGADYIDQALDKKATLVLVDSACEYQSNASNVIVIEGLAAKLAALSAEFYQQPSQQFQLVGVTGTNGKSTITSMIANLASFCQQQAAVIGTLGFGHPNDLTPLANTTPSAVELQKLFYDFKDHDLVAMEVSSHGLVQNRVAHTAFDVAVFSNLSRDHLDYHGTMTEYAQAKYRLFSECGAQYGVINVDDEIGADWFKQGVPSTLVAYGKELNVADYPHYVSFSEIEFSANGINAHFATSWGKSRVFCPLFGLFNLYNLAAAMGALLVLGYSFEQVINAIKKLQPVAGRMEPFSHSQYPTCIVDYAHTPDALSQALQALKAHSPGGVTCVFGCGGDRDRGKRALMAKAAEEAGANQIIVTNDNPRSEDPHLIAKDILQGFQDATQVTVELDRKAAIAHAITNTTAGNLVLVAGKGHEDYQLIGSKVISFSDRETVKELLKGQLV